MKKLIISLCLMHCIITFAQETKINTVNKGYFTEHYTIDKKTSLKHGLYFRMNNLKPDTLITGAYEKGEQVGEWSFYDNNGKLYLQYDYAEKAVKYLSDTIKAVDKFFIKTDTVSEYVSVDRAPIYLSDADAVYRTLATGIALPDVIAKKKIKGKSIAGFEIDTKGNLVNIQIKQSLHPDLDKKIVGAIGKLNEAWLPAIKDGEPVVAGYIFVLNVLSSDERPPKVRELPFMFTVTLVYYGRTEIRV